MMHQNISKATNYTCTGMPAGRFFDLYTYMLYAYSCASTSQTNTSCYATPYNATYTLVIQRNTSRTTAKPCLLASEARHKPLVFLNKPEGFYEYPLGSSYQPEGCKYQPEGFSCKPEGSSIQPNGLLSKPEGFSYKPEGSSIQPNGLLSKPNGYYNKPNAFLYKPEVYYCKPNAFIKKALSNTILIKCLIKN